MMFMSARFSLGAFPSFKSKERSSEVLTGQTRAISLTAITDDARSAERNKVSTSPTGKFWLRA